MKKIGLITLGLIACIALAGCSHKKTSLQINPDTPLTKVGQYHKADSENPKMTLLAIKKVNKTVKIKQVTFKLHTAKFIEMKANNNSQISDDKTNFGIDLPKTYYEYQIDYTIKNGSNYEIQNNGAELILPNGKQVSSNKGAMDSLIGETIQPHASKDGYIQARVSKNDENKLTKFKFVSPELFDNDLNINISHKTFSIN